MPEPEAGMGEGNWVVFQKCGFRDARFQIPYPRRVLGFLAIGVLPSGNPVQPTLPPKQPSRHRYQQPKQKKKKTIKPQKK